MARRNGIPATRAERQLREESMVLLVRLDEELARVVQKQWSKVDRPKAKETFARVLAMVKEIR